MKVKVNAGLGSEILYSLGAKSVRFSANGKVESPNWTNESLSDVWVIKGPELTDAAVQELSRTMNGSVLNILVEDPIHLSRLTNATTDPRVQFDQLPELGAQAPSVWEDAIVRKAERMFARGAARGSRNLVTKAAQHQDKKHVAMVGAGIVNLITAEYLASRGYRVEVIDGAPDPRNCEDWTRLGVTHGGGNARMFTFTECDNYNEKDGKIYADMQNIFRNTVQNGCWSVKRPEDFGTFENTWIDDFESVAPCLARIYGEDIFEINAQSGKLWNEMIDERPDLFQDVFFCPDIIRLYDTDASVNAAAALNTKLGSLLDAGTPEAFIEKYPVFHSAIEAGESAGGLTVRGFTVSVHRFCAKLIERIEALGGSFRWNCTVDEILRDGKGEVEALACRSGRITADHYVLSPGVRGNHLLEGTASEGRIQGILGIWLHLPNLEPKLHNSVKIHRGGHVVEDINVTIGQDEATGEDILVLGGGYGYVGMDRPAPDSKELAALFAEMETVARLYFPQAYEQARANDSFYPQGHRKFCVRPFTADGLGIFEILPTDDDGQLIITGGHNTGGFAQAPAIARAVYRAFEGIEDPMHTWYHPSRRLHAAAYADVPNPVS